MVSIHHIETLELPELRLYRSMKGRPFPFAGKYFIAEGEKMVLRLLESDFRIESMLLSPEWYARHGGPAEARAETIDVFLAPYETISTIVGFKMHQCAMAVAHVPPPVDPVRFAEALPPPRLMVALDGIVDAENMGGIVRNCAAFGVKLLLINHNCCSPFLRRSARVSMGGIFTVPIAFVPDLAAALRALPGIRKTATHLGDSSVALAGYDFPPDQCLVFGSEGEGITDRVLAACDDRIRIPMARGFDSLNVATACGIILHAARGD